MFVVCVVYTYKNQLIEVFDHIINAADFDGVSVREEWLKEFFERSHFYLEIFNLIFQQTA